MNEILDIIKKRRSLRSYNLKSVEKEKIDMILEAAIWAPSSNNSQPWYFTIIKNDGIGSELNLAAKEILQNSDNKSLNKLDHIPDLFYGAPIIIVISGLKNVKNAIIDCSAATQNMLLVAESIGLSTCWNGLVRNLFLNDINHKVIKKLKIPENYKPLYAVAVGYSDKVKEPPSRKENQIKYIEF